MSKRLSLCIGINDYPGINADLSGCVNDAMDWSYELGLRGYWGPVVLDAEATKARVTAELHALVAQARSGDRVVVTFSGHGTWVPDKDGDEADKRDEALVLYDWESNGLLVDDEMHKIMQGRRHGVRMTVLADCCHSGTVSRFAPGPLTTAYRRPRFVSMSEMYGVSPAKARALEQRPASKPRSGVILISGCSDSEYSYDARFNGRPNGAFTRVALDALGQAHTTARWVKEIHKRLPSADYPQTPQLVASLYQRYSSPLGG